MRVYRGKINWLNYAVNEGCIFAFPGTFQVGQVIHQFWQWTKDAKGNIKPNAVGDGYIDTYNAGDGKTAPVITFHVGNYYTFEATISLDEKSLTIVMKNPTGHVSDPFTVELVMENELHSNYYIYTGKFNDLEPKYANNEMMILILSPTIVNGSKIGVFWQWTLDWHGNQKVMETCVGTVARKESCEKHVDLLFNDKDKGYDFKATFDSPTSIGEIKLEVKVEAHPFDSKGNLLKLTKIKL